MKDFVIVISFSAVLGAYKFICYLIDRYKVKDRIDELLLFRRAEMNLMREIIRNAHKEFVPKGEIDEDELQHIEEVYETYHQLGGNGTATRWMNELRNLKKVI